MGKSLYCLCWKNSCRTAYHTHPLFLSHTHLKLGILRKSEHACNHMKQIKVMLEIINLSFVVVDLIYILFTERKQTNLLKLVDNLQSVEVLVPLLYHTVLKIWNKNLLKNSFWFNVCYITHNAIRLPADSGTNWNFALFQVGFWSWECRQAWLNCPICTSWKSNMDASIVHCIKTFLKQMVSYGQTFSQSFTGVLLGI